MRFHFVMLLIVVLVSLSMHSMASAAAQPAYAAPGSCVGMDAAAREV
jgi:hypothetical protein